MKKYNSGLELQSRDVNLVLRKTSMIIRQVPFAFQEGRFRKGTVRILKFFSEIMKDQSKIIFQVIFYIDQDFNNSRKF